MKRILGILLSLMLILTMMPLAYAYGATADDDVFESCGTPGEDYSAGEVIAYVRGGAAALKQAQQSVSNGTGYTVEDTLMDFEEDEIIDMNSDLTGENPEEGSLVLIKGKNRDVSSLVQKLESLDCVEFAEPNMICEPSNLSDGAENEPCFDEQWYLDGSKTGTESDMDAKEAYSNSRYADSSEVVVAVMDTGVDYTHPDLKDSMWSGGDKYRALKNLGGGKFGINTSGDGAVSDPMDVKVGHGTHCASTIASTWNNAEGIAGANGHAKIMACRWMDELGYTDDYIKAMDYVMAAKDAGVNVVATNNSWGPGGSTYHVGKIEALIAEKAASKGITSVFAAGNAANNHDRFDNQFYGTPYIVTVGAIDSTGAAACFSDTGARTVDVVAPGTQILAATSLHENNREMSPQYLPWLDEDKSLQGTFFYEDFEDDSDDITFEAYKYVDGEEIMLADSATDRAQGYCDSRAKEVDLSGINSGDEVRINLSIPLEKLENLPPDAYEYYMAFQAGKSGFTFESINDGKARIIYPEIQKRGGWNRFIDPVRWRCIEDNWSASSSVIYGEEIRTLIDNTAEAGLDEVTISFPFKVLSAEKNASFHIDCFGFGTEPSDYYYSDGTSMAAPCAAAVTSLIAGSMGKQPSNSEDCLEIIARLKGGAEASDKLKDVCGTQGLVKLTSAFKSEAELNPVPDNVEISPDGTEAAISGNFFGNNKGEVQIDGAKADVISWTDKSVKVKIDSTVKTGLLEYRVTRADGRTGREFGVFVSGENIEQGYQTMKTGDFAYDTETEYPLRTKDLIPFRIAANNDGIMALLADVGSYVVGLEFYSFETGKWSQIELPEILDSGVLSFECYYSLVGGGDEFYLYGTYGEDEDDYGLCTYSTSKGKWIYEKQLRGSFGNGEVLGLVPGEGSGRLMLAMGENSGPYSMYQIYPDTGRCEGTNEIVPTELADAGWGGEYLVSGDMQILAGINHGATGRNTEASTGEKGSPCQNPAVKREGKWETTSDQTNFFDIHKETADGFGGRGLDKNQVYIGAYGATDTGFIMAGPSRNLNEADAVDTWIYDAKNSTYKAVSARADEMHLIAPAGTCHDGKFYLMARSSTKNNKLIMKSLDLRDYGLTSTDCVNTAERDGAIKNPVAIGNLWLDDGYYIVKDDGTLTHEGSSEDNYQVNYDSENNRLVLNDAELSGVQAGHASDVVCELISLKDITIELHGENGITVLSDENAESVRDEAAALNVKGNIVFTGDGNLTVDSGSGTLSNGAVKATGNIEFDCSGCIKCNGQIFKNIDINSYTEEDMSTTGVKSGGTVAFKQGTIEIKADPVERDEDGYKYTGNYKSTALDAKKFTLKGEAEVKLIADKTSSLKNDASVASRTVKAPVLSEGIIETFAQDISYTKAPVLAEGYTCRARYGRSKSKANAAGDKYIEQFTPNAGAEYSIVQVVPQVNADDFTVKISASAFRYNGKVNRPSATVTAEDLGKIEKRNYEVKYSNSKSRDVGSYKATVIFKGDFTGKPRVYTYKINPKGSWIKKLTADTRSFKVYWGKQSSKMSKSRIAGYQIQYALDSKFTSCKKTVTVKGYSRTSRTISKLKAKKKYYVHVRTYKRVNGKYYHSSWSRVKTVRTK